MANKTSGMNLNPPNLNLLLKELLSNDQTTHNSSTTNRAAQGEEARNAFPFHA